MPISKNLKIAKGINGRLDFDFCCGRGHYFCEYFIHGTVNEILSANIDPKIHKIFPGYAHPTLNKRPRAGRPKEIDFAINRRDGNSCEFCAEVKWAGSSHCTPETIFMDLCRLQKIKNEQPDTICIFILSGPKVEMTNLFLKDLLKPGTQNLLHYPMDAPIGKRTGKRIKEFNIHNDGANCENINVIKNQYKTKTSSKGNKIEKIIMKIIHNNKDFEFPKKIRTSLVPDFISSHKRGRFNTLSWTIEI